MDLREALDHLAMLGTEQTVADDIDAGITLREALDALPKKQELALWPANQAKPLALLDTLQDVLRGIVYDMAREEVLNQVQSIAGDALAARESAEVAAKHYAATKPLAARLLLLEEDLGVHTRQADDATLWTQMEEQARALVSVADDVSANNEALVGGERPVLGRLDTLEGDLDVHSDTRTRVAKLEAGQVVLAKLPNEPLDSRLGSLEIGRREILERLDMHMDRMNLHVQRLDKLEDELNLGLGQRALEEPSTAEKLANLATAESGELAGLRERVAKLERDMGTRLGRPTELPLPMWQRIEAAERELKDLGQHPALT